MFSALAAVAVFYRATEGLKTVERRWITVFMAVTGGAFLACSYQMILQPFYNATNARPLLIYITATIYAVSISALLVGTLVASIRASVFSEFFFWFSFLLLIGTDFALRYQDIGGPVPQLNFFEYGWNFSIASMASLVGTAVGSTTLKFSRFINGRGNKPSLFGSACSLNSIRVITASVALISLVTFLAATWIFHSYLSVASADNIGSQLVILTFIWAFANLAALFLSRILNIRSLSLSQKITEVHNLEDLKNISNGPPEFDPIIYSLHELNTKLQVSIEENIQFKSIAAVGLVASQVSHDIRSPLAALEMCIRDMVGLPEDRRVLVRSAVNRIKDIANNLLQKNREAMGTSNRSVVVADHSQTFEDSAPRLISSLLESVVTEKRIQFRSQIGIEIHCDIDSSAYGVFALVQLAELQRAISNLINNSVEALPNQGNIEVNLTANASLIEILIQDDGSGIPPEIVKRLGTRGETHGKAGGSGLGLYHARQTLESWGGGLQLESIFGKGTTVRLQLPRVAPPTWFVEKIAICEGATIAILDDDLSIHKIWTERLNSPEMTKSKINAVHFSTPAQLKEWCAKPYTRCSYTVYLLDYELIGQQETGLDLIENLGIAANSILVTSYYEEKSIIEGCSRLGVRLIPKPMAGLVPVEIKRPALRVDAVLLDDDSLVHMTWEKVAHQNRRSIRSYYEPKSFFEGIQELDRRCPVYLDVHLGNNIRGKDLIPQIRSMGFQKVFLTTGYEPEIFVNVAGLTGIVGKEPPISLVEGA